MALKDIKSFRGIYQLNEFNDDNGNQFFQLIKLNYLKNSGVDIEDPKKNRFDLLDQFENDSKLDCNLSRVKRKIFEYVYCNPWEWFFTGTIDPKKYDAFNLDQYHKDLTKFIANFNFRYNLRIKFLFIPEKHKVSGGWHVHGFFMGLPEKYLIPFTTSDFIPKQMLYKLKKGSQLYHWKQYEKRFGFCDLEPIRNHEAVSKYVTKYVTKELENGVTEIGAHSYYCSRGLKTKKVLNRGYLPENFERVPDFKNEYIEIWNNL